MDAKDELGVQGPCRLLRSENLTSRSLDAGVSVGVQGWTLTLAQRPGIDAKKFAALLRMQAREVGVQIAGRWKAGSSGGGESIPVRKSYAQIIASSKPPPAVCIGVKPPTFTDSGEPAVFFSPEEVGKSIHTFNMAIIVRCAYGQCSIPEFKSCISQRLLLKVDFIVSTLNHRHLLLRFEVEDDYMKVVMRRSLYIKGLLYRFFKWDPQFDFNADPTVIPIWIGFPMLPVNYYYEDFLRSIAGNIGHVLRIYEPTMALTQTSEAFVYVELDIVKPRLDRIWIGCGTEGFWQKINFYRVPAIGSSCHRLGHAVADYRKKQQQHQPDAPVATQMEPPTTTEKIGVKKAWNSQEVWHPNPFTILSLKLKSVKQVLRAWNKEVFGDVEANVISQEEEEATGYKKQEGALMYLGVPLRPGRNLAADYKFLIDKFNARLGGWKSKLISQAGRVVLINSVLSSNLIYLAASSYLPKSIIYYIEKSIAAFFWNGSDGSYQRHWVAWHIIQRLRQEGGLGVRSIHYVQKSLAVKQIWNIRHGTSLWSVYARKRFSTIFDRLPSIPKQTCMEINQLLQKNTRWIYGKGKVDVQLGALAGGVGPLSLSGGGCTLP
ncbi:hypothetical protein Taro_050426, partial [Colocasia esculenta]|nr:hypothetical protein [Colocasia esculenta]